MARPVTPAPVSARGFINPYANYRRRGLLVRGGGEGTGTPGPPGPPGPQGEPGPPGDPGEVSYRHVQSTAATTWTVSHPLPFRPNVTVVDSTGREIIPGAVDYTAATVTLTFSAAFGGEAYLS